MTFPLYIQVPFLVTILVIVGTNFVACQVSSTYTQVINHGMTDGRNVPSEDKKNSSRKNRSLAFGPSRDQGYGNGGAGYGPPSRSSSNSGGRSSSGGYFGNHGNSGGGENVGDEGSSSPYHHTNSGTSSSSYGSSPSSSSYGSYGSYGSSSSSQRSPSSSGSSYGSSHHSSSNYGSSSSSSGIYGSYNSSSKYQHEEPMIPLAWVILLIITSVGLGMLITAKEFISNSEGTWANFCRLSVSILECFWKIVYNCYHCRLSEIPNIVWTGGYDDDDVEAYTEQELQTMKPRPGIERALDVEHKRSMNKLKKEYKKEKTALGTKIAKKVGVVERGPGLAALLGERKVYMQVNTSEPTNE